MITAQTIFLEQLKESSIKSTDKTVKKFPPLYQLRRCCLVVGRLEGGQFTNVTNAQYCARRYDTRSDTVTNAETLSGFFADIVAAARPAQSPMCRPNLQKPTLDTLVGMMKVRCRLWKLWSCGNSVVFSSSCGPHWRLWSSGNSVVVSFSCGPHRNSVVAPLRWWGTFREQWDLV